MPYNPGVVDRSGEILANGINNTMAQYAQNMELMRENERKRRTAAGQVQGILASNPQLASKADPALIQKMSMGKANLNDTMQLLGTLSTVQQQQNEEIQQQYKRAQIEATMSQIASQEQQRKRAAARAPLDDQLLSARIDSEYQRQAKLQSDIDRATNTEAFKPEMVDLGDGVTAMTTSAKSAVPIQRGAPAQKAGSQGVESIDIPGVGSVVVDKVTREPLPANRVVRAPATSGGKLDPMLVGTLTQQIQKLEAEKLQHQQEIAQDDKRYGLMNIKSRADRIQEIDAQLTGLRATLKAGGKSAVSADAPAAKPTLPVAENKPAAAPGPSLYRHEDVQAELRRRGLIQ